MSREKRRAKRRSPTKGDRHLRGGRPEEMKGPYEKVRTGLEEGLNSGNMEGGDALTK